MIYKGFRDSKGNLTAVESHSYHHAVPGSSEISEQEFFDYIKRLPEPILEVKLTPHDRLVELLFQKGVISATEAHELNPNKVFIDFK